jgi:Tfp pilus assembly protein FimT
MKSDRIYTLPTTIFGLLFVFAAATMLWLYAPESSASHRHEVAAHMQSAASTGVAMDMTNTTGEVDVSATAATPDTVHAQEFAIQAIDP